MHVEKDGFFDSCHPLVPFLTEFTGGHLFSAVDGHAGHTCAHAVNLIHADYITAALLPHSLVGPVYHTLCRRDNPFASSQVSFLSIS